MYQKVITMKKKNIFIQTVYAVSLMIIVLSVIVFGNNPVKSASNEFNIGCDVGRQTSLIIPNATYLILAWDKEIYDTGVMFDMVYDNHYIYIKDKGRYAIDVIVSYLSTMGGGVRGLWIYTGTTGNMTSEMLDYEEPMLIYPLSIQGSIILDLQAGDKVGVISYQNSGSDLELSIDTSLKCQRVGITENEMTINLGFPTGFYVMIFALVLMFISFFIKSILIKFAVFCCMLAVMFEPAFKDTWFQAGAAIIMVWCIISIFMRFQEKGAD